METKIDERKRSSWTEEERSEWVARYQQSGLSLRAFTEQHGLKFYVVRRWIRKHRSKAEGVKSSEPVLREISLEQVLGGEPWSAEVCLASGTTLRLRNGASPELIQALLRTVAC